MLLTYTFPLCKQLSTLLSKIATFLKASPVCNSSSFSEYYSYVSRHDNSAIRNEQTNHLQILCKEYHRLFIFQDNIFHKHSCGTYPLPLLSI